MLTREAGPELVVHESAEDADLNPRDLQVEQARETLEVATLPELIERLQAWKEKVDAFKACKGTTEVFKRSIHDSFLPELIEGFGIDAVEKVLREIRAEDISVVFGSVNPAYTAVRKLIPNEEERREFLDDVVLQTKFELETLEDTARKKFEESDDVKMYSVTRFFDLEEMELYRELREKVHSTEICCLLFEPKIARIAGRLASAMIEPESRHATDWGWNKDAINSGLQSLATIVDNGHHMHMNDDQFGWAMQGIRSAEGHNLGAFVRDAEETLEVEHEQLLSEIDPMLTEFAKRRIQEITEIEETHITATNRLRALMRDQIDSSVIASSSEVLAQLLEKNIAELRQLEQLRSMRLEEVARKYEMKHLEQVVTRLKEQRRV